MFLFDGQLTNTICLACMENPFLHTGRELQQVKAFYVGKVGGHFSAIPAQANKIIESCI